MTLCPIALAVGCKKCPIVSICPLKKVIGDFGSSAPAPAEQAAADAPQQEAQATEEGEPDSETADSGGDDAEEQDE